MFDRQLISDFIAGADRFLGKMREQKNPTRWTSVGALTAVSRLSKPRSIELIDYRQAVDEQGQGLISSAAMALLG